MAQGDIGENKIESTLYEEACLERASGIKQLYMPKHFSNSKTYFKFNPLSIIKIIEFCCSDDLLKNFSNIYCITLNGLMRIMENGSRVIAVHNVVFTENTLIFL